MLITTKDYLVVVELPPPNEVWVESFQNHFHPMNPERKDFLNLRSKPGRFTSEETAWFLGFLPHELPMLVGAGLLTPLGNPSENGCKYYSYAELDKLKQDPAWLAKACDAIVKYWKDRNLQRPTENAKARWPHKRLGTGRGAPDKKSLSSPLSSIQKNKTIRI